MELENVITSSIVNYSATLKIIDTCKRYCDLFVSRWFVSCGQPL